MAENRLKVEPKKQNKENGPSKSIFNIIDNKITMGKVFDAGLPVKYIPYILHVLFLGILYIGTTHYSDRLNATIFKLHKDVQDLRSDYTTLKSDYMLESKQSEVAKKVKDIGLIEDKNPPRKIIIDRHE
jgi:Bacteriodetes cell division protein (FtsL-like)